MKDKGRPLVLVLRRNAPALPQGQHNWKGQWYSYPWPDELPGLGRLTIGPFDICADCEAWSWARYGGVVLCLACACARERGG